MALVLVAVYGCGRSALPPLPGRTTGPPAIEADEVVGPRLSTITREPMVRVRVAAGVDEVVLTPTSGGRALRMSTPGGEASRRLAPPVRVWSLGQAFRIESGDGRRGTWRRDTLVVESDPALGVAIDGTAYPGTIVLHADGQDASATRPTLDAINHVGLETYLPGVLEKELFPHWHRRAFEAQAIAARSYAIFEHGRRSSQRFDVESTTVSQVYGGKAKNPTAIAAARATRGLVLVYDGRVVPAFYSSSAGGRGQDGAVAFPNMADLPPLRGRDHLGWGSQSPAYRWGPVTRHAATLSRRLAAWGERRGHAVASLGRLADIAVIERSRTGRPAVFRLTDTAGRRFDLPCETFRHACNFAADGDPARRLPALARDDRLKSSDVAINRVGPGFAFTGRGHGHGVGMDQYGAQHLATTGYPALDIVSFYYPSAAAVRAY